MNMGWERILRMKICNNFETWNKIVIFYSNAISRPIKNHPIITHILHLCNAGYIDGNRHILFYVTT